MLWTQIAIEPCDLLAPQAAGVGVGYCLHLPLVSDGRIAFVQLCNDPARARVWRHAADGTACTGNIHLIAGQWSIVWECESGPLVRFTGARFLCGDLVCLRPEGSPLQLYRVTVAELLPAPR